MEMRVLVTLRCTANGGKFSEPCDNYSVSQKKIPPTVFCNFFPNGWEFLINFLHTYYVIISTLDYKFLFNYLEL